MQSSGKLKEKIALAGARIPHDPFAVDIFGAQSQPSEPISVERNPALKTRRSKKSNWASRLPGLTNREVEISDALQNIPAGLSLKARRIIIDSLARLTFRQPQDVDFATISVAETHLNEAISKLSKSPKLFLTIVTEAENAEMIVALDSDFAAAIVDLVLGGNGEQPKSLRDSSPIEQTILQFLVLNILREINPHLGESSLVLQKVASDFKSSFPSGERGAEIVAKLVVAELSGIISLIIPRLFLQTMGQNPLLSTERKGSDWLQKIIPHLQTYLQIGKTTLDAESLVSLEPDDIVLLETSHRSWHDKPMTISVGRELNVCFSGTIDEEFNYCIDQIKNEEMRLRFKPARIKMDEKETQTTESETKNSTALENVQITLRVEIGANQISLRELQTIHSGQVIALGCRPTDPVRIVTDNNSGPIATGELIEIEGQLGVRLTKVFI